MRNPLGFIPDLLRQPAWVPAWVGLLMMINLGTVAFLHEPLARWILGIFMVSAFFMMGLYARFGFEKILGVGHVLWLPLLPVVLLAVPNVEGGFRAFLVIWAAATTVSLTFDIMDVWTWYREGPRRRGPRTETT